MYDFYLYIKSEHSDLTSVLLGTEVEPASVWAADAVHFSAALMGTQAVHRAWDCKNALLLDLFSGCLPGYLQHKVRAHYPYGAFDAILALGKIYGTSARTKNKEQDSPHRNGDGQLAMFMDHFND